MNKTTPIAIDAGAIFTPLRKFAPGRIIIDGRSVREVGTTETVRIPDSAERVDASRFVLTPGFVEPHIHGCGGVDVMACTFNALNAISRTVAKHGTTAFLPTTVSSPLDVLTKAVEELGRSFSASFDGATPLGIHLEGPFISSEMRGTHKSSNIVPPNADLLEKWIFSSNRSIRLLTIAPELDGIDKLVTVARRSGVAVAMGHSNATLEEARRATDHGVCYGVHTFNAMRGLNHRDPGIVGEVLADDRIFAEIISDGVHVDPAAVRIFARAKGKARVLIVTDATSATDMPDGQYRLGEDRVQVKNGICRDSEGRLAGSTLTQEIAFRNFVAWTGWSFEEALLGLTLNPAQALKLDLKGALEPGCDADIAIMDPDFRVVMTFVEGRKVYGQT